MIAKFTHACTAFCSRPTVHRILEFMSNYLGIGGHGPFDGHNHFGAF